MAPFTFVPEEKRLRASCANIRCMDFFKKHPLIQRVAGILIFGLGFIALITPLTPGAVVLMLLGLELLGLRGLVLARFRRFQEWWKNRIIHQKDKNVL